MSQKTNKTCKLESQSDGEFDLAKLDRRRNSRLSIHMASIRWRILTIAFIAAAAFTAYLGFNLFQAKQQATLLEERLGSLRSEQRRLERISGTPGSAFDDRRFKAFVKNLSNLAATDIPKSYADLLKNAANVESNNAELAKFYAAQAARRAAIEAWIADGAEGNAPSRDPGPQTQARL